MVQKMKILGRESIMRLTTDEINSIKEVFQKVFESGELYLFGSRVDDTKRGGDIDLFLSSLSTDELARKKIDFLVQLKQKIGDQKIDVVIDRGKNRVIDKIAKQEGVLLWKS